jgi:hypothetical protein
MLVAKGIFEEVFVSFLLVGHTHEDIDATFRRWSMNLRENDFPTILSLMKSFMLVDLKSHKIILSLIEEVLAFMDFINPFIARGKDKLIGHTRGQQFKFLMQDGEPIMQYKILCTDSLWKPDTSIKLWRIDANRKQMLPEEDPLAVQPIAMRNQDDIIKGSTSFFEHWECLARKDPSRSYARSHSDLIAYWKGVRDALKVPPPSCPNVQNGFWPATRVQTSVNDTMTVDGIVREEFAEDEPFIGLVGEQPRPSFRVARDVYEGYMLLVRHGDEEIHVKPVWVALALSDPMLSSSSERFQHIRV